MNWILVIIGYFSFFSAGYSFSQWKLVERARKIPWDKAVEIEVAGRTFKVSSLSVKEENNRDE